MERRKSIDPVGSPGFGLLELAIALTIAALLVCVALPGIVHAQREWTLWSAARMVEISLQWGRMRAVASNAPLMFEIRDGGRSFGWADPESGEVFAATERHMGSGTRIVSAPSHSLRFYPRGNAVPAGTYKVAGETGSYSVVVAPGGRIRIQRN